MMRAGCGIICEYNPFHNGHAYQIKYAKETLGLPVVCVMSGNFVQRGEPAFADKIIRANHAVENGASVVLELPFPYSSMTAERFAKAGVDILTKSGMCSHLLFGSECADVEKLTKLAEFLLEGSTKESIQVYQKENPEASFAKARESVVRETLGDEFVPLCKTPNDILATEYIKAIISTESSLVPVAIKRSAERNDVPKGEFASSSQIREMLSRGDDRAEKYVPYFAGELAFSKHTGFKKALHLAIMTKTPEEIENKCECSGLSHAIVRAARESASYEDMFMRLKSKSLTDAKIRRMLIFAYLGVSVDDAKKDVAYTKVLAMSGSEEAKELMRICRKNKSIIVAQRASAVRKSTDALRQYEKNELAQAVLAASENFN